MITLKGLTIVAALLAGVSLAMAQNGLPTGGQPPVAGGANGNPVAPGFDQAPGAYTGYMAPGYGAPAYIAQPGYVESGPAPAPGRVHTVHRGSMYMYVPPRRSSHAHKITPNGGGY